MLRRSRVSSRGLANYFGALHHPAQGAAKGLAAQGFRAGQPLGRRLLAGPFRGQRMGRESPCVLMRWSMQEILPFGAVDAVPPISPAVLGGVLRRGAAGFLGAKILAQKVGGG